VTGAQPPLTIERLDRPSAEDRAEILRLEADAFTNPWTPETFDWMLASPAARIYVAREGPQILAFCACYVFDDEIVINTVAVETARRRQGIARALLQAVLRETGARRATLEVRRSNSAALCLYEGLGFRVTASRTKYYEKPEEDALILWLNP
jgi:ribosomal-protein-alanine N-acetyltransferase